MKNDHDCQSHARRRNLYRFRNHLFRSACNCGSILGGTSMPDRLTKILLSAEATGLRMNVTVQMFDPQTAIAQGGAESYLLLMESTLTDVANGRCRNPKIC